MRWGYVHESFSALQRAENSSIGVPSRSRFLSTEFQCSSASRKFLNPDRDQIVIVAVIVSVLFSEPKIPQCQRDTDLLHRSPHVSVLFSEPKIPQSSQSTIQRRDGFEFQCSSASRKFLNRDTLHCRSRAFHVSVLFSEPKIPQYWEGGEVDPEKDCFSALQRAENSSIMSRCAIRRWISCFSALQRAENSSIQTLAPASIHISDRDDHASSFLSLPGASP